MVEKIEGWYALTQPAVMAFPNLFVAKAFMKNGKSTGEPKFGANFVIALDSDDWKGLRSKAMAVAKAKFPDRTDWKNFGWPFQDGTRAADKRKVECEKKGTKPDGEYTRGKGILSSRSKFKAVQSVLVNDKVVEIADEALEAKYKAQFYFGVQVLAEVNFVAYDKVGENGLPGVTAYINKVLSLNKGEKLSGATSSAETFKGYVGIMSADDPTKGAVDDDIPF